MKRANQNSNITIKTVLSFILLFFLSAFALNFSKSYLVHSQSEFKNFIAHTDRLNDLRIHLTVLNEWLNRYALESNARERYLAKRKVLETLELIDLLKNEILSSHVLEFEAKDLAELFGHMSDLIKLNEKILEFTKQNYDYSKELLEYRSLYNVVDFIVDNLIKSSIVASNKANTKKLLDFILILIVALLLMIIGAVALLINIHKRRNTEYLLKKTKSYLNNVINSMPSMLVGIDKNGKVININKETETVCHKSSKDVEGLPLADVLPELEEYIDEIKHTVSKRSVMEKTKLSFSFAGNNHFVNLTSYPLVTNGIEGAVIRIDDVTKKVRMEEMMMQTEKMLSLGGLAAGIAHEVNNPLAAMLQTSQVVLERLRRGDLPANVKVADKLGLEMQEINAFMKERKIIKLLEGIYESGVRVASIVDNMLNFARKGAETFSKCNVKDLIDRTLDLAAVDYNIKMKYDFRTITVEKNYGEPIPDIYCDLGLIQQVLLNILKNAAQALHLKREVEKDSVVSKITLNALYDAERSSVIIKISDNGPGMDELTLSRLFEPFFTTKETGTGTGLGMSVSYFIIKDYHGGDISVESKLGEGTVFTLSLPVRRNDNEQK